MIKVCDWVRIPVNSDKTISRRWTVVAKLSYLCTMLKAGGEAVLFIKKKEPHDAIIYFF